MPIALAQASAKAMVSGAVFDPPMISASPWWRGSVKFMLKKRSGRPEASASGVHSSEDVLEPI